MVKQVYNYLLIQKKQKIKAGTITARSCHTAIWSYCTTVTSASYLYS